MHYVKPVPRISQLRIEAGLTQFELAQLLDVTESTVANWESGRSATVWLDRFVKLCKIFDCTPDQLIEYVPEDVVKEKADSRRRKSLEELRELINPRELPFRGGKPTI